MTQLPARPGRTAAWLPLLIAIVCAGLIDVTTARAQAGPSLSIAAGSGTATVSITDLDASDPFNGFDITLGFDASLASVTGVTGAGSWNIDLVAPVIDNTGGTVQVVGISLTPACGTGCMLFTVTFAPQGAGGQVPVNVTSSELATTSGQPITPAPGGATPGTTVQVGQGSPASPTATSPAAPPTATPTTPAGTATPTVPPTTPAGTATSTPTTAPGTTATPTATATPTPLGSATPGATATPTAPGSTGTVMPTGTPVTQVTGSPSPTAAGETTTPAGSPTPRPPATGSNGDSGIPAGLLFATSMAIVLIAGPAVAAIVLWQRRRA